MLIFNAAKLAADISQKRQAENLSFRQAARQADVSSENTIMRAESGTVGVNIDNFTRIVDWLGKEPGEYFKKE